jgi:hypothetical protein
MLNDKLPTHSRADVRCLLPTSGRPNFRWQALPSFQELGLERQTCWKAAAEAAHKQYAQPQADTRDAERWGSEPVTGKSFLQEEDQRALHRLIETSEDNEGFDIGKEAIKRLANLGLAESFGFGRYGVTRFGYWVHEHYWYQNPSLPLKTNLDRDADARAAIAAAKEKTE